MKTRITAISFGLFIALSAFVSEYSIVLLKHNQQYTARHHKVSFVYGWVEYQGNKRFFIQENHYSPPIQKASIPHFFQKQSPKTPIIERALDKICKECRLISVKQADSYDSLLAMNSAKNKLIHNKSNVLMVFLPKFFAASSW